MKQQSRNLRWIKYIIAAALVAAIVIASFFISQNIFKEKYTDKLSAQKNKMTGINARLCERYDSLQIGKTTPLAMEEADISVCSQDYYRNIEALHTLDEVKALLQGLPDEYALVVQREDIYSVMFGMAQNGLDAYNKFISEMRLHRPAELVMAQFTTNFDPIYYYVEYNGSDFHVVEDKTRDGYDTESGYSDYYAKYLKVETYDNSDGIIEYAYLSDDESMSYQNIKKYFAEVEKGNTDLLHPEFWEFYIGTISAEEMRSRVLPPDRVSKEFKSEYDGFADLHPSFNANNPIVDYDGDGILDRVYRDYHMSVNSEYTANAFLFLGNGKNLLLGSDLWGEDFKTEGADFTGNGSNDICFIQYTLGPKYDEYEISIFEYRDGEYVMANLPEGRYSSVTVGDGSGSKKTLRCLSLPDGNGDCEEVLLEYVNGEWKIG